MLVLEARIFNIESKWWLVELKIQGCVFGQKSQNLPQCAVLLVSVYTVTTRSQLHGSLDSVELKLTISLARLVLIYSDSGSL